MQIIPGDHPDVRFEVSDLSYQSVIIIRRESVTCCGFLGGDTILVIRSGAAFADLLEQYRPVIPMDERGNDPADGIPGILERRNHILTVLRSLDNEGNGETANTFRRMKEILSFSNRSVWFAGSQDPFRFELELSGDIQGFLNGAFYPQRLTDCLHWWYRNEATPDEQVQTPLIPGIQKLLFPVHHELIIRAINLYNHGTYEVARDLGINQFS